MSDPLRTPEDYELFIYTLKDQFPSIRHSTVTFVRKGTSLARVNRIPAPKVNFNQPNLPVVIQEIDTILKDITGKDNLKND